MAIERGTGVSTGTGSVAAPTAAGTSFDPAGGIVATNVQDAIEELDSEAAKKANNLSDLSSASSARTNLGLGTMATQAASAVAITGGTVAGITDLAVADGGTGASTAANARTNLGLGTGDSPEFTAVNIGAAADTTVTRTGAGDIAVEGKGIYRADGTDVPVTDGGTGGSTAVIARANLNVAPIGIPENISLVRSVAANALTMNVKGADGNAPSATNVVGIRIPDNTGGINYRTITGALSLVISSGSTLGHNSGLKQYIYWYLIDNAGTLELAASSKFFGWHGIVSTTAEGGAGAADSGTTMYSTTARSTVAFVCIAYSEDTQAAAGTWATNPSAIFLVPFSFPIISFSVHKNGSNQGSITNNTDVKVTFSTELYDNGALFDSATNYRWVPPPGTVVLLGTGSLTASTDNSYTIIQVNKNGSLFKRGEAIGAGAEAYAVDVHLQDECNGTDYYEMFVSQNSGSDKTVNGAASVTYFMGKWEAGRS